MNKINLIKYILFCFLILFLLAGNSAQAKNVDHISVFHADGTAFSTKPLVFETNILPGDKFTRGFFVKKKDKFDQVLTMSFKRKMTSRQNILARKINVRLKRLSDG